MVPRAVVRPQRVLFAHSRKAKVHFLLVMSRAAAAIVVLSILLTSIFSPAACCGVLCSGGHRTEAEHAHNKVSQPMGKMVHHHSPERHSVTAAAELLLAKSCRSNCSVAETSSSSPKSLLQETSSQNRSAGPQPATKLLADNCGTMPTPRPTPPEPPGTYGLSFNVLRI
jgi:hypothetical protein